MKFIIFFIIKSVVETFESENAQFVKLNNTFPQGFLLGIASAAYQIEGAWSADGKGVSIWDTMTHEYPELVVDGSNGDIACDSYHKYKQDVQLLKEMGVDFYRFSISWPRILPKGYPQHINQAGIDYYNNLIDELLNNGIQPMVTMYHWDLPQSLQDLGGWSNRILIDYFEDYARILFKYYGDRVKWWITFNEPSIFLQGYAGAKRWAPSLDHPGIADYLGAHTVILAHAKAYRLYETHFKSEQQGKIGMAYVVHWCEPMTNETEDVEACERYQQFNLGLYAHPIYGVGGDYPEVVKTRIENNSFMEGLTSSRLPSFTAQEVNLIRGTYDFFALNHYTTVNGNAGKKGPIPSLVRDSEVMISQDPWWPSAASSWLKVKPSGFRKTLNWIAKEYNNLPVFVTENGFSDTCGLNDTGRINYHISYLKEMLKAIHEDGCNVIGYTVWTLMDNFQWTAGYAERFGMIHVDFNNPSLPRTPKESYKVFSEITKTRRIPQEFVKD